MNQVTSAIEGGIPEVHTLTDAVTDALWLWLYEYERLANVVVKKAPVSVSSQVDTTARPDTTDATEAPRPESNGRPKWSDVDLAELEESDVGGD